MTPRRLHRALGSPEEGKPAAALRAIRYGGVIALLAALVLLAAFYLTVATAAQRAELAHKHARLEIDRRAACSAFTQPTDRSRCAVGPAHPGSGDGSVAVVGSEQPPNDLLSTAWRERHVVGRRPHRTAGLY